MIYYTDEELEALGRDTVSLGIFFRLETDPVIRRWLAFGTIDPGVDTTDPDGGGVYLGLGELKDVPPVRQLLNGAAERVEFVLSGVSGAVFDLANDDPDSVKGRKIRTGFALMRPDWSMMAGVHWLGRYRADYLAVSIAKGKEHDDPIVRTLSLAAATTFAGRRQPQMSTWTDPDQKARYPGDRFCEDVSRYANGLTIKWPSYA